MAAAACFAVGAFVAYVVGICFAIQTNWSCCPDFITAVIAASVIMVLDDLVKKCNCIPRGENIVRCILNLAMVSSLVGTLPQTTPCERNGWLVFLIVVASLAVIVHTVQVLYLALRVLGFVYTEVPAEVVEDYRGMSL